MSDIQEQIKIAHKRAEENDIREIQRQNGMTLGEEQQLYWEDFKNPTYDELLKENKRLNNIIDELEKEMNKDTLSYIETQYVLDKLKELKEESK